jgi:molybdate transport system substrate-binding protein
LLLLKTPLPTMSRPITCISSMATRQLLAELAAAFEARSGRAVQVTSVGGVDAAKRVAAGEVFDVVMLASDALDKLAAAGHLKAGTRVDLVRSPVAVAVRDGATAPDISTEAALQAAVAAAPTIGYSTGPSGAHLVRLFERWGQAEALAARTVQAPPGVPVGSLVARGDVALGFQQLSELMHLPGLQVLGTLPGDAAFITTFSAALCPAAPQPQAALDWLAFMAGPEAEAVKQRHGMAAA